jgi:hypothetical protein
LFTRAAGQRRYRAVTVSVPEGVGQKIASHRWPVLVAVVLIARRAYACAVPVVVPCPAIHRRIVSSGTCRMSTTGPLLP